MWDLLLKGKWDELGDALDNDRTLEGPGLGLLVLGAALTMIPLVSIFVMLVLSVPVFLYIMLIGGLLALGYSAEFPVNEDNDESTDETECDSLGDIIGEIMEDMHKN